MPLDATKRPQKIPPKFAIYAEQHEIFDLFERLLQEIIIDRPQDPLSYMVEWLKSDQTRKIRAAIVGPPGVGKRMLATHIENKTGAIRVNEESILSDPHDSEIITIKEKLLEKEEEITDEEWTSSVIKRLTRPDCKRRGWVLEGFPRNRIQAIGLQEVGLTPEYLIVLDAPNNVLEARQHGKKLDPVTGENYHPLFNWSDDQEILDRLENVNETVDVIKEAEYFRRQKKALLNAHKKTSREINADQPLADIKAKVVEYIAHRPRSLAKRTARVILIGPRGSGKATLAAKLVAKYNLVLVNVRDLVLREKSSGSRLAARIIDAEENSKLLDTEILVKIIDSRCCQSDCVMRGWVLYGLPLENGSGLLSSFIQTGHRPNRIYFLDIPTDSSIERISYRTTDTQTGLRYHGLYDPPPTTEIQLRCVQRAEDQDENVRKSIDQYMMELPEYLEVSDDFGAVRINADQDAETVFELTESKLVNPLPSKFATDEEDEDY